MKNFVKIPGLVSWLFYRFIPEGDREYFINDIQREYIERCENNGEIAAWFWFLSQFIKSIPSFFQFKLTMSAGMLLNYIKITFRNIKKQKSYSLINISGLSVGLTCCILILLYIRYELSYDTFFENSDSIYQVTKFYPEQGSKGRHSVTPGPLAPTLKSEFPEVLFSSRVYSQGSLLLKNQDKSFWEDLCYFVDQDYIDIFSIKFLSGNPERALSRPHTMIITEDTAEKYFRNENPVGKTLKINNQSEYTVTGIIENVPVNTHFRYDMLLSFKIFEDNSGVNVVGWDSNSFNSYIRVNKNTNLDNLHKKVQSLIPRYLEKESTDQIGLLPVKSIHLMGDTHHLYQPNSDKRYLYLFAGIALTIIIIACLNYMNLSTARSAKRAKEIGMRKVSGATRKQIQNQFLGESIILILISFLFSIMISAVLLPSFGNMLDRDLSFNLLFDFKVILGFIGIVLTVGLLSGLYTAIILSSMNPVNVLKSSIHRGSKRVDVLRNTLVVLQFAMSIIMIICSVVIFDQISFMENKELGFTKDFVVTVPIRDRSVRNNSETLINELTKHSGINEAGFSYFLPNSIVANTQVDWPGKPEDQKLMIFRNWVGYNFAPTFNIEILEGTNFLKESGQGIEASYLVNESAVKEFGWESPVGMTIKVDSRPGRIIGVFKDFHYRKLDMELEPLALILTPGITSTLSINIKPDNTGATLEYIKETMKRFSPDFPFEYSFVDEIIERSYRSESRLGEIFQNFTLISILLSCMGLFGLASFTVEQRRKELGVRKVIGASSMNIVTLLSSEFTRWIVIANVFAWPVGYYAMRTWLDNFAYTINLGIIQLMLSAVIVLVIAFLTISIQTIKAARANPVDSLRYE